MSPANKGFASTNIMHIDRHKKASWGGMRINSIQSFRFKTEVEPEWSKPFV